MVVAYMDVDLSTDLRALLPLVAPLVSGHSDITIGSRLTRGAQVVRGPWREVVSLMYNRLLRLVFRNQFRVTGLERQPPQPIGSGGDVVSFATVGAVSTAAYFTLFLTLRGILGDYGANAVALTTTMVANTSAHRAWTFGRRAAAGRRGRWREWGRAVMVHVAALALTSAAIATAGAVDGTTTPSLVVLLQVASVLSSALRLLLMPAWVFPRQPTGRVRS